MTMTVDLVNGPQRKQKGPALITGLFRSAPDDLA
jgi:hypothetical protein